MIPVQVHTFRRLLTTLGEAEPGGLGPITRRARLVAGYSAFEAVNAGLLAVDHVASPFSGVAVEAPLFLLSPPRSGSTLLHRLLALDEERFTAFRLWQLAVPSLTGQRLVRGAARLDRRVGAPLGRRIDALEARHLGRTDRIHKMRLRAPEEDEALLLHAFATEMLASPFPVPDALAEYRRFDALPDERRRAIMAFYKGCVQRHLLLEGAHRTFLSKNPFFCHKVGSVHETFPDARFVLLVRRPDEAVASLLSMLASFRGAIGLTEQRRADRHEEGVRFVEDCYVHALGAIERLPAGAGLVLRYEDLVASPKGAVETIYRTFGLGMGDACRATLEVEEAKARAYRSPHQYALGDFGLRQEDIEARFGWVYERFGYPSRV